MTEVTQTAAVEAQAEGQSQTEILFKDTLAPEFKNEKVFESFKDVNGLAKSYINAVKMASKKVSDFTKDDAEIVNKLLGKPEKKDDYKFIENIPESLASQVRDFAFEAGLSNQQASIIAEKIFKEKDIQIKMQEADEKRKLEERQVLIQTQFGTDHEKISSIAIDKLKQVGGEGLVEKLKAANLLNDIDILNLGDKLVRSGSQDTIPRSDNKGHFGIDATSVLKRIEEINSDPVFKNRRANDPKFSLLNRERNELYAKLATIK